MERNKTTNKGYSTNLEKRPDLDKNHLESIIVSNEKNNNHNYLQQIYCNDNNIGDNIAADVIALSSDDENGAVAASEVNRNFSKETSLDLEDECSQYFVNANNSNTPTQSVNIEKIDERNTKQISQSSTSNTPELVEHASTIQKDQQLQHLITPCRSSSSSTNSQYKMKKFDKIISNVRGEHNKPVVVSLHHSPSLDVNEEAENQTKFKDFSIDTLLNKT